MTVTVVKYLPGLLDMAGLRGSGMSPGSRYALSLDLVLLCFLPSLECRASTLTELHEEIDRRFAEAGIEIAFPQRDLHLRSMPEVWPPPPADVPKS